MSQQSKITSSLIGLLLITVLSALIWNFKNPAQQDVNNIPEFVDTSDSIPATVFESVGGKQENGTWKMGYSPDPESSQRFRASLKSPYFSDAGPQAMAKARDDSPVFLYRALYEAYAKFNGDAKWQVRQQGIGDCVSWGWAHGADIHLAVLWKIGASGEWREAATESIYGGSRVEARGVTSGGWSDGSYGSAAAKWVKNWGILFRQDYSLDGGSSEWNLITYSASKAKQWGNYGNGGKGDNGKLDTIAKKHPIRNVAVVRNFEEASAAIQSGYPIPVCSMQGFSSRRDNDGFAAASGRWAHCMCFIAVRYGDRPGLLCLNSWGPNWISGPAWPEDMPAGSFWVDKRIVDSMLAGADSFAISGYEGFPYIDLHHGDWVYVTPKMTEHLVHVERDRRAVSDYSLSP